MEHKDKIPNSKQSYLKVTEPAELMSFLIASFKEKSRNDIKSLLVHRQVSVDYKTVTQYNHQLKKGQEVIVNWGRAQADNSSLSVRIMFEDPYLMVVEKKHGLLSIATDKHKFHTAYNILSTQVKKENAKNLIFIVHRLDRDTSGLMLFAKSEKVQEKLQSLWHDAIIDRRYVVVVEGVVEKDSGTIISWLKENKALVMYSSKVEGDGQKAITHYKVLKRSNEHTLLEVQLETGRKNQIRVHMQELGHSVIGDEKYGASTDPIKRLGLHARVLEFRHPITEKDVRFETNIPRNFLRLFEKPERESKKRY